MRTHKMVRKILVGVSALLAGGTVLDANCMNTVASIPICGTILPRCTPYDQLAATYPMLQTPDYTADPSCTIPLACGNTDIYSDIPDDYPFGGEGSEQPSDSTQGIGSTGTGGGG